MTEQNQKIVEKYYIEVNAKPINRFFIGLVGGIGWGVGLTVGTGLVIYLLTFAISKIDLVPVFGSFLADVIQTAQSDLQAK